MKKQQFYHQVDREPSLVENARPSGLSNSFIQDELRSNMSSTEELEPEVRLATTSISNLFRSKDNAEKRGELAVRQARQTYVKGQSLYGEGSWETQGSNKGPLIKELNQANHSNGSKNYEWCGMYVGHSFEKAGIRPEILKSLVFWSGIRLHLFFTKGVDINNRKVGDFVKPHQYVRLNSGTEAKRKKAMTDFGPRAGDVVLFKSDYSHVGIVDHYDSKTGELMILEGNSGNRVRATTYDSGDKKISFIGRFNSSDFGKDVDKNLKRSRTPKIDHDDIKSNITS